MPEYHGYPETIRALRPGQLTVLNFGARARLRQNTNDKANCQETPAGAIVPHKGHQRVHIPRLEVEESRNCLELCQVEKEVDLHALSYEANRLHGLQRPDKWSMKM